MLPQARDGRFEGAAVGLRRGRTPEPNRVVLKLECVDLAATEHAVSALKHERIPTFGVHAEHADVRDAMLRCPRVDRRDFYVVPPGCPAVPAAGAGTSDRRTGEPGVAICALWR